MLRELDGVVRAGDGLASSHPRAPRIGIRDETTCPVKPVAQPRIDGLKRDRRAPVLLDGIPRAGVITRTR